MPEQDGERDTWTSVRLTPEERAKLSAIAQREHRKMSQQIRVFIYEAFERRENAERAAHRE